MDLNLVARPFQLFDVVWLLAIMLGLVSLLARPVRADEDDDDDDDVVGVGMYVLIGFAALVVVVMYSWMGWTLYQGIKEGKKRN
eukprot:CAMPEP_0185690724 /NCGR_PEP_ID=MMETSP1164-20130828/1323_1 /TAXON_ID=1104430 /ORGANISM="Chrysoreinhardia sp, Strain CCMP2950" /LENGTH=83 /DNA_ID=CAMNT_0028357325 /DNA_START=143 /DNA_END=394 /DNA_ORIENTATION=-